MLNEKEKRDKANEQAEIIREIVTLTLGLDVQFLREANKKMRERASTYDAAAAIIGGGYSPNRSTLMDLQAATLEHLCAFVDGNHEISIRKIELKSETALRESIAEMFGGGL